MFGTLEDIEEVELTQNEKDTGLTKHLCEERSLSNNWFIDYYIYEDKVIAIETMEDNSQHCKAEADTLEEVLAITATWC